MTSSGVTSEYELIIDRRVTKRAKKIPAKDKKRVMICLKDLEKNPFPKDCVKLKGSLEGYRTRVGNYRILYKVDSEHKLIEVYLLIHRSESYPKRMP